MSIIRTPAPPPCHYVLGLDLSLTRTGYSRVSANLDDLAERGFIPTKPDRYRCDRLIEIRTCVLDLVRSTGPHGCLVVIESEAYGALNPNTDPAAVQAVVQVALWERIQAGEPWRYLAVAPSQLKKYLGAPKKAEVLMAVLKRYGVEIHDDNEADAYGLSMIGVEYLAFERGSRSSVFNGAALTKPQLEVLAKLLAARLPWERPPQAKTSDRAKARARRRLS